MFQTCFKENKIVSYGALGCTNRADKNYNIQNPVKYLK